MGSSNAGGTKLVLAGPAGWTFPCGISFLDAPFLLVVLWLLLLGNELLPPADLKLDFFFPPLPLLLFGRLGLERRAWLAKDLNVVLLVDWHETGFEEHVITRDDDDAKSAALAPCRSDTGKVHVAFRSRARDI